MGDVGDMDDGRPESGRTRLARGTKPHALSVQCEVTGDASPVGAVGALPAVGAAKSAPAVGAAKPAPAVEVAKSAPAVGAAGSLPAGGAASPGGHAPAQSIREAVEQLIEAQEADEAIAEWMQGGG